MAPNVAVLSSSIEDPWRGVEPRSGLINVKVPAVGRSGEAMRARPQKQSAQRCDTKPGSAAGPVERGADTAEHPADPEEPIDPG